MNLKKYMQLRLVAFVAIFLIVAAGALLAQSAGTAGLVGTITDPSGAAVPNVTVTLTSNDTNQVRTATSGGDGQYKFTLLPPGTYKVRFAAGGFKTAEIGSVTLNVTESATLDRKLEVGGQSESVTVEASAETLQTASSTLGTTVGTRTVTELPLASRNYTQIIGLSAGANVGVNNATSFGKGTQDMSVNGNNPGQNNFQMDGVAIQSMASSGSANDNGIYVGIAIPSPDSIAEFRMGGGQADPQTGLALGHGRRANGGHHQPRWRSRAGKLHRPRRLADHDRNDLAGRTAHVPALRGQLVAQGCGPGQELAAALGLGGDDVQRGQRGGRGRRRRGRGKDVRPGPVHQPLDQRPAAGHESADAAQGLAQRADADGDRALPRPGARPRRGRARPNTPVAWASSTSSIASCRAATSASSASGARSPSMLNRLSVTISRRR